MFKKNISPLTIVLILVCVTIFYYFWAWLPAWIPQLDSNYQVAKSIPIAPKTDRWDVDSVYFGVDVEPYASISYSTQAKSDEFISFYSTEMVKQGWVLISNKESKAIPLSHNTLKFNKVIRGTNYFVNIPVSYNSLKGISDNIIFISQEDWFD